MELKKKKKKDAKLHSSEEIRMVSIERWNFNWTKKDAAHRVSWGWVSKDSCWFLIDGMPSTCLNFRSEAMLPLPTPTFQDPSLETEMILVWLSVQSTEIYQEPTVFLALFWVLRVYQWEKKKTKTLSPTPCSIHLRWEHLPIKMYTQMPENSQTPQLCFTIT